MTFYPNLHELHDLEKKKNILKKSEIYISSNALAQKTMIVAKSFIDITQEVTNDAVRFIFVHFQGTWEFIMEIRSVVVEEMAQLEVSDFNARAYVKVAVKVRINTKKERFI